MKTPDRHYFHGKPGQRMFVQEWGPLDRQVVLLVHGFPGCADHGQLMSRTPHWNSFRLIAMDRPGYGQSDAQKNITPLRFARQFEKLLDEKGIREVSIISVSGGAPYSLALAYVLKNRVRHLTSIAGVAPLTPWNFRHMNSQQKKAWALQSFVPRPVLKFAMKRVWNAGLEKIDRLIFTELENFTERDRQVFADPEIGPALARTTKHALKQGPDGILGDMRTYARPWGFKLKHVKCPVTLWHGLADDVVNVKYAEEMARRLPQAKLHRIHSEGHYSLLMNQRDNILQDLLGIA